MILAVYPYAKAYEQDIRGRTCLHLVQAVKVWAIRPSGTSCSGWDTLADGGFHGFENCGREPDDIGWVAMALLGSVGSQRSDRH